MIVQGTLMRPGLRTRRRREAVERVADRLPPDLAGAEGPTTPSEGE